MRRRLLSAGTFAAAVIGLGAGVAATPAHADGGVSTNIVGGRDATQAYPWMVSIQQPDPKTGKILHYCGGSLIRSDEVVTAGHCGIRFTAGVTTVRVGAYNWQQGGTPAGVAKVTAHPAYVEGVPGNDIAVLHLDRKVPQKPITIARTPGQVGDLDRIIGWGATCDLGSPQWPCYPTGLQEADVRVVDDNSCSSYDRSVEVCVKGDKGQMACFGDSGGPLAKKSYGEWVLIGATSGDGDADGATNPRCSGGYGIWTDVTKYTDWINEVIDGHARSVHLPTGPPGHTQPVLPVA